MRVVGTSQVCVSFCDLIMVLYGLERTLLQLAVFSLTGDLSTIGLANRMKKTNSEGTISVAARWSATTPKIVSVTLSCAI